MKLASLILSLNIIANQFDNLEHPWKKLDTANRIIFEQDVVAPFNS
jgi:hypothetical protein